MACDVVAVHSKIRDRVPEKPTKLPQSFEIAPGGTMFFDDSQIKIDAANEEPLDGMLDFTVRYGRKGSRKRYELSGKKRISMAFDRAELW